MSSHPDKKLLEQIEPEWITEGMAELQSARILGKDVDVERANDRAHHVLLNPHAYRDNVARLLAADVVGLVERIRELGDK